MDDDGYMAVVVWFMSTGERAKVHSLECCYFFRMMKSANMLASYAVKRR